MSDINLSSTSINSYGVGSEKNDALSLAESKRPTTLGDSQSIEKESIRWEEDDRTIEERIEDGLEEIDVSTAEEFHNEEILEKDGKMEKLNTIVTAAWITTPQKSDKNKEENCIAEDAIARSKRYNILSEILYIGMAVILLTLFFLSYYFKHYDYDIEDNELFIKFSTLPRKYLYSHEEGSTEVIGQRQKSEIHKNKNKSNNN